jgi:2-keto-4-pentenoate hydratase
MPAATRSLDTPAAMALERLAAARASGRPCAPVRTLPPGGDIGAAYAVPGRLGRRPGRGRDSVVGRKIGLTNWASQAQLSVGQPDFGTLLSTMACRPGEPAGTGRLLQPKIEAEVAFMLQSDLDGAGISPGDVLAATGSVAAALEIAGGRIAGWDISIVDTVADNASSGLFTVEPEHRPPGGRDPAACPTRLRRGEEEVSTGSGAACLGHPAVAVAWLATAARSHGQPLRSGEIVLSGALGPIPCGSRPVPTMR